MVMARFLKTCALKNVTIEGSSLRLLGVCTDSGAKFTCH